MARAVSVDPKSPWHDSVDDCAHTALTSLGESKSEQAGVCFKSPDGKYGRSTSVDSNDHDHFSLAARVPKGHSVAAIWHTHLGTDDAAGYFSPDDIKQADALKVPSYIRFDDGSVRVYRPGQTKLRSVSLGQGTSNMVRTTSGDPVAAPKPDAPPDPPAMVASTTVPVAGSRIPSARDAALGASTADIARAHRMRYAQKRGRH